MYQLSDYYYDLPTNNIAQTPIQPAHNSKLLYCPIHNNNVLHIDHHTKDLPELLQPDTLLIANNSQVFASRLPLFNIKVTLSNGEDTTLEQGEVFIVRALFSKDTTIHKHQCIIR